MQRLLWVSDEALHDGSYAAGHWRTMLESLARYYAHELEVMALCATLSRQDSMRWWQSLRSGMRDCGDYLRLQGRGLEYIYAPAAGRAPGEHGFDEQRMFFTLFLSLIEQFRPDVLMVRGHTALMGLVADEARQRGIPQVLCVGAGARDGFVLGCERILTDWQAAAEECARHGLRAVACGPFIELPQRRGRSPHHGRVTMMLPAADAEAALALMVRLAQLAREALPGVEFLLPEPQEGETERLLDLLREDAHDAVPPGLPDNVLVINGSGALEAALARTRLLLYPAAQPEWQPYAAALALSRSIPVLGSCSGALPEASGEAEGAACCLPFPSVPAPGACLTQTDAVQPWLEALSAMLGDAGRSCARACVRAMRRYDLQARAAEVMAVLRPLLRRRSGMQARYLRLGSLVR